MADRKTIEKYPLLAAIFCICLVIIRIINMTIYSFTNVLLIAFCVVDVAMAVAMLTKRIKAVIVVAGISAIIHVIDRLPIYRFGFFDFFIFISAVLLFVLMILVAKGNKSARKIWFIPGCVLLLLGALYLIRNIRFFKYDPIYALVDMVYFSLKGVSYLLISKWAVTEMPSICREKKIVVKKSAACITIGGADKLKSCKELLDSGIITQEEFEEKKKQILGL